MSDSENAAARLDGVTKRFGDITALNMLNLTIPRGRVLGLLGPNGAGKTTLVRLLLGMTRPNAGTVTVFGSDPHKVGTRQRMGAMLQVAKVPETLRVREHIQLFSSYYPRPLPLADSLACAGLTNAADRLFGELSGGQKQRVLFALALCGNPDLLLLDEPTVGLDVEARRNFWDQIRDLAARGKTIVLTTHYLEEADALSDQIVVINGGSIVTQGSPRNIKASIGGKLIRCKTALTAEDVRPLPGVLRAGKQRDTLELRVANSDAIVRQLLARDPSLSELEIGGSSLDDAFLALTRNDTNHKQGMEVYQ